MKKLLCLLLALCLVFALFGCKKTEQKETKATEAQTETDPTTTVDENIEIVQRPMVSVATPVITETTTADDGTEIFHYSYPTLNIVFQDAAIAEKVVNHHRERLNEHLAYAEDIRLAAVRDYAPGENFMPYLYGITYNPMRIDQSVLSIYGNCITYSGGVHPNNNCFGANYDMVNGEVLTLGSILKHADQKDTLKSLLISELDAIAEERYLSGYKDYVETRFAGDVSFDEDWYFSTNGLCFFFSPYEIAPYSEGIIVVEISYEKLSDVIADEYFPGERVPYHGTVQETPFSDAEADKFTQISELVLQSGSDMTLYYTDKAVLDFRIIEDNPTTGYTSIIFATPYLTPGDAVLLEATAEAKKNLTIVYIDADQEITITY